jgi:dihydroflavonol-4-reductase
MANDLVLVTGASGYIAGHCIIQLLDRGYRVRGTLRSLARADEVSDWIARARGRPPGPSLEFVEAELTDPTSWPLAMEDVRYVLHVASPLPSTIPRDPEDLIAPAREGALNVLRAAAAAKVERVVQTSSSAAIAYGRDKPDGHIFTEEDWTDPGHSDNSPYTRSKTIAERAAWDELKKLPRPLEWVAINPALVLGPVLDKDASASVEFVGKMLRGEMPGLPRLTVAVVDVRDIADLHLRAMIDPRAAGQRYIGAGEMLSMSQMAEILRSQANDLSAKVPKRALPDWLVRLVGLFDREVGGLVFELGKVRRLTGARAMRELGWKSRPAAETVTATARSLEAVGALSKA